MYKILGADGKIYGPVSAEQLRQWLAEGRANAQTQTFAEGATEWRPLGALPEFAGHFAPSVPPVVQPLSPGIPGAGQAPRTSGYATAGLILGILSFVCCFKLLFGALGLIFSLIGLSQINRHPELYEGRALAIAGIVLSILSLLLFGVLLLLALATGHFYFNWSFR
ncbi:MAG TPA: DUF4190 domain-containing protein [Candidatus Nitrosopolaris sp.]|nr:DUF4190 domain-containing protein [Candidatus Nitrosopolaris sp.]